MNTCGYAQQHNSNDMSILYDIFESGTMQPFVDNTTTGALDVQPCNIRWFGGSHHKSYFLK